ncbi:MAG: DNA-3-methyladenine glycosylase I [Pseudomonadota bacterium]
MSVNRCPWCGTDKVYTSYHDTEWGVPEWDSRALWEKLILDGFQAGLSWITILRKRDAFRAAFAGFDPERVAAFGEEDIARLLSDPGIVRHRGKIEATIKSANLYLEIEADQGFSTYLWSYVDGAPVQNTYARMEDVPAFTPLSEQISKDLKARGFRFVGPTIVYAAMQAMGLVNDHLTGCFRHTEVAALSPAPATRG